MKSELRHNKDFWSGAMFIGFGGLAIIIARGYSFGSTLRMGPGYFPTMLGGILVFFGICIIAKGLRRGERIKGRWSIRALVVLPIAIILFGLTMQHFGFVPALAVLVFGSAASGEEFKWIEVLLLTAGLVLLSIAVFIWGLGLPYPLFKTF